MKGFSSGVGGIGSGKKADKEWSRGFRDIPGKSVRNHQQVHHPVGDDKPTWIP